MSLHASRRSVSVQRAFGDARENFNHVIASFLLVEALPLKNLPSVIEEVATEEQVDQVDVADSVDQIKELASDVSHAQVAVRPHRFVEVTWQQRSPKRCISTFQIEPAPAFRQLADDAVLVLLPDPVR